MRGDYQDGTRLAIGVTDKYEWALLASNASWNLNKSGFTDVIAFVDNKHLASGKAFHLSKNIAALPLSGSSAYRALQAGYQLELLVPSGNLKFALTGTAKAMTAVLQCVAALNARNNPSPALKSAEFQQLTEAEAAVFLSNLLSAADLKGYKLDPPQPNDGFATFTLPDGSVGMFRGARGSKTKNADDYTAYVIGQWSNACKGDFLSGKQAVPSVDGSVVRNVTSTCRIGDKVVVTETHIIRRADGFLMELSQSLAMPGSQPLEQGVRKNSEALVNAAMRFENR